MNRPLCMIALLLLCGTLKAQQGPTAATPPLDRRSGLYTGNRDPLAPSPLIKLPIGSIQPRGYLRELLVLQRSGMAGQLPRLSRWCNFEGNAWVDPEGKGHSGWEEMPYWLKGYGDMGYVLKDEQVIAETRKWIEAIYKSQREDGWFGPRGLLTSLDGKADLWPNMLVLNILQSHHEVSGDARVIPFMQKYCKWQMSVPEADFMVGYWPHIRASDNIESVLWLYNRTGEAWLLDLAHKIHRRSARWDTGIINWHGVNITQGFRQPTVYWMLSLKPEHLAQAEKNYQQVMGLYGQVPGGMFGADENARKGYDDPRQAAETCSMVEFMHSFEMLTKITGQSIWLDRCEEVAFNSLPAALTPDLKALRYLTSPNQIQADRRNKSPGLQNGGTMVSYSPLGVYRCCQHNHAHGWPYMAIHLWMATSDKGLAATLYAPSEVKARVADGTEVSIATTTDYPFADSISFKLSTPKAVQFPLYLRVPGWCADAKVSVNGQAMNMQPRAGAFIVLDREWKDGDAVTLTLPMKIGIRTWAKNHNSVSVDYGPLTFSLKIGERWAKYGGTDEFPEQEVFPTTAWNYGLVLDSTDASKSFEIVRKPAPVTAAVFTHAGVPIELKAKGRKIPQWKADSNNLIQPVQDSPARTTEPVEEITLIPMGAARLRITAFPVASDAADAKVWQDPPKLPLASHCFEGDTTAALNDGQIPKSSGDQSLPRMTFWPRKGTTEWVQYDYDKPRRLKASEVYWFDDTGRGQCRIPASWRLLYRDGGQWKEVAAKGAYGTAKGQFNKVTFDEIETTGLRLEVKLQGNVSGGMLEWKVE